MTDLRVRVSGADDGALVLTLQGELDRETEQFVTTWMGAFPGEASYVLDLRGVGFIDSGGLRALLKARALAEMANASILLRSPSTRVLDLLLLTGLEGMFDFDRGAVGQDDPGLPSRS